MRTHDPPNSRRTLGTGKYSQRMPRDLTKQQEIHAQTNKQKTNKHTSKQAGKQANRETERERERERQRAIQTRTHTRAHARTHADRDRANQTLKHIHCLGVACFLSLSLSPSLVLFKFLSFKTPRLYNLPHLPPAGHLLSTV